MRTEHAPSPAGVIAPVDARFSHARLNSSWQQGLGDFTFVGQRVDDLMRRQLRFAVVPEQGKLTIAAETAAAQAALDGALGPKLTTALETLVQAHADGGTAATQVKDITLTTSEPGMRATSMVNAVESGWYPVQKYLDDPAGTRRSFGPVARIRYSKHGRSGSYSPLGGSQTGGHVLVSPMVTRLLLRNLHDKPRSNDGRLRDNWPTYDPVLVLSHELEHTRTPMNARNMSSDRFFEEAGAAVLAEWPGRGEAIAADAGLRGPHRAYEGYKSMASVLRMMLSRAGIDPSNPRHYGRARDVLQARTSYFVPGELAKAIVRTNGAPEELVPDVRRVLRDAARSNWKPERTNMKLDAVLASRR